ncbi:alpha/beta hydrolase [Rahnella bruchi]
MVPSDIGNAFRKMVAADDGLSRLLETIAAQAIDEAHGAAPVLHQWIPDTLAEAKAAGITDIDMLQAITYCRTERGQHANSTNRSHYLSDALILGFDAIHLAEILLTQPVHVILAGNSAGTTGSFEDGYRLSELDRAAQPLIEIAGSHHYQMYDVLEYVVQAVEHLDQFFTRQLAVMQR